MAQNAKDKAKLIGGLVLVALFAFSLTGCERLVKTKTKVQVPQAYKEAKTATLEELVDLINHRYAAVDSLTVRRFRVEFKGGSLEQGYFEKYPKADGYLIAKRPDSIYVNILNPLTNSTVVTMATENGTFEIWAPRDNKYLIGKTSVPTNQENPLYNVRPSHILDALLIKPIPVGESGYSYFREEAETPEARYYVVPVVQSTPGQQVLCLRRKLWIERSTLRISRQEFYECGELVSDVHYGNPVEVGGALVSTDVDIDRVREHYQMNLEFNSDSIQVDRPVKPGAFQIPQPPGAEVVNVGEGDGGSDVGPGF